MTMGTGTFLIFPLRNLSVLCVLLSGENAERSQTAEAQRTLRIAQRVENEPVPDDAQDR